MNIEHVKKEIANSLTHGLGFAMAAVGVPILLFFAYQMESPKYIAGAAIYGVSLLMVYLSSTLYHSFQSPRIKHFFRILDHISIYFLIAGSYTPFILLFYDKPLGWTVLTGLWCIVAIGSIFKIFYVNKWDKLSTSLYIAMGWAAVLIAEPFIYNMPLICIIWLAMGGLSYTLGTIFYFWKGFRYHHAIWHLFVLFGSFCHYIAVLIGVTRFY